MTAANSSSVMFTMTRSRRMPALLTTTLRSPNVSIALLTIRWAPSQSVTLSPLATASPPAALISSATCSAAVRSLPEPSAAPPRSLTTTFAPSLAKSSECSRPMPRPPPVMIATRPSREPTLLSSDRKTLRGAHTTALRSERSNKEGVQHGFNASPGGRPDGVAAGGYDAGGAGRPRQPPEFRQALRPVRILRPGLRHSDVDGQHRYPARRLRLRARAFRAVPPPLLQRRLLR